MPKKNIKFDYTKAELKLFKSLNTPRKIQDYLDKLKYNIKDFTFSARGVIKNKVAHCFDGAIFAAAALEVNGHQPFIIDLKSNGEDDDHILAIFKVGDCYGAIGKSNYVNCRFRDPIYKNLRELVMSYFHIYFNLKGTRTLRQYSKLFDLAKINDINWRTGNEDITPLGDIIDNIQHFTLITKKQEKLLTTADARTFKAETLGVDKRGAFKV